MGRALGGLQALGDDVRVLVIVRLAREVVGLDRGLDLHLKVEQVADGLLLDGLVHGLEQQEPLALVLDQRVALGHRAQADALLQVVHLVQVLAPLAVEHTEDDAPLELAHDVGAELGLAGLVAVLGVRAQLGEQHIGAQPLTTTGLGEHLFDGDPDRVQGLQRYPKLVQVPVLGEAVCGGAGDVAGDHVVQEQAQLVVQVFALKHPSALTVDDLTLAVQDVIVLQHVLANLEVLPLDLALGRGDRARDQLGLDRDVVGDTGAGHEPIDQAGVEQAHQVVLQRQVEPAFTRVALTTRAAPQLVVDPPRLVPLSAEHIEPAGVLDLVVLARDGLGRRLKGSRPGGLVLLRLLGRVQPALAQRGDGHELSVAAEHDVGAAAGHVRGHGDCALAAGLGHDRGLSVMLLGVEHLVGDPPLAQQVRQVLALGHARRTDQDRLAGGVSLGDVVDDGAELGVFGAVDQVGLVLADHLLVGGDLDHAEPVDLVEL